MVKGTEVSEWKFDGFVYRFSMYWKDDYNGSDRVFRGGLYNPKNKEDAEKFLNRFRKQHEADGYITT